MNYLDALMSHAAVDHFTEVFGARDELGDMLELLYLKPNGEEITLTGWSISQEDSQESINASTSAIETLQTIRLVGPASQLTDKGVNGTQVMARVRIGDVLWHIDPLTTKFGGPIATIGLKRMPLNSLGDRRNAGV